MEVSSSVSERSRVVALPSGVLEWQQHAVPVRVRRGDGWVLVDTGLRVLSDGRVAPEASTMDVRFSRGGSDPLVTMSADGGSASMSWPADLPSPVLDGDTAVYRDVLPEVDLRVRATATGFTHVLVVKTAAAAANPVLRSVRYGWSAQGLQLRPGADGGVDITDSAGETVFSAAPGSMWDSGPGTPSGAQARMLAGAEGGTVTADGSDATGPGDLARVAPVQVQVSASELTVVPDESMLSAADVVFPLFIDPPVDVTKNRWGYANNNGNNRNDGVARAGKNPDGSGVYRSYFEFNISSLAHKFIYNAKFYINATHTSPCAATPVNLWATGEMQAGVNGTRTGWAPSMDAWADQRYVEANTGCGDPSPVAMEFGYNLYYHVRWRTDRALSNMTVGLATYNQDGYGEGVDYWKKFDPATAKMTIWFNTHPGTPVAQAFNTTTDCFKACSSSTGVSVSAHQAQGWWRLNETSGSTAADAASPAHTLTKAGSGTVSWADGGAVFNNAYLQASTKVLDTSKSFTVSAWAKLADTNNFHTIVSQDGSSGSGFHLRFDWSSQRWAFIRQAADSTDPAGAYANSTAAPSLNVWTHLVGVYVNEAREKSATLYVNGVRQSTVWADPVFSATGALVVGRAKWAGGVSDVFAGGIDNVQTYQRQLNDSDVTELYKGSAGRSGGALNIDPAQVRTTTPKLSFKVSDAEAGAKLWSDVEVRTAPVESGTPVYSVSGLGGAGVPSGTVMAHTVPSGKLANGTTYYWRARSRDEENWYGFWSAFQAVKVDTSPPAFGSPPVTSVQYPEKQWGAVVGTAGSFILSASVDTYEFEWWVDGGGSARPVASNGKVTVSHTPAKDMVHTLYVKAKDIAGNVTGSHGHQFWVAPMPVKFSHWRLDELSGTLAADSGNAASYGGSLSPATLSSSGVGFGPGWVQDPATGETTNGLVFTGNGTAAASGPVIDTTKQFTAMAWVNPSDLGVDRTVLSLDGGQTSRMQLHFDKDKNGGSGAWCFSMRASDGAVPVSACTAGVPAAGVWVHVAAVYNPSLSSNQLRVYVMGDPARCEEPPAETAAATFTGVWSATGSFVIGRAKAGGAGTEFWRGGVDDVWANQKALTGAEICSHAQP